ncbi:hypothetical protein LUZ63_007153 [Rhynchospora breviuscula]|uniref:Bifunctional inhibitor/plant lipid transfer protein/seed storage helical domain-containing protein n=1 Tax=Rhynchospora breviuscula TaxID=2022672 RepID=A0A9Q0CRB2_9POAL|nr:hypothetical protein LUZ63_007153 [Rhynchospora breviuscula]
MDSLIPLPYKYSLQTNAPLQITCKRHPKKKKKKKRLKFKMAKSNTPIILLVLVVATMLVATNASGCDNDINSLSAKCLRYVSINGPKLKPDQNCCNAIQEADIPCVCTYLTPEVEKIISADKVVYVAQQCGRPLKPGTKCGSVVVHG